MAEVPGKETFTLSIGLPSTITQAGLAGPSKKAIVPSELNSSVGVGSGTGLHASSGSGEIRLVPLGLVGGLGPVVFDLDVGRQDA
jgi:hypothetical protein